MIGLPGLIGIVTRIVMLAIPGAVVSWRLDEIRRLVTVRATVRTEEHARVYFQREIGFDEFDKGEGVDALAGTVAQWIVSRARRVGVA